MAFPVSPINGATTLVNGINYVYSDTTNSWTRVLATLGNLTIAGNINAEKVYTTSGLFWAGNNQQVVGSGINITTDVNPPGGFIRTGDQWYATDIGVLFEYINDGDSEQWVDITSAAIAANSVINLSAGDFSILGHITPGLNTVYDLGNVSYQWRNLYVGGVATLSNVASALGYFWANGAPAFYSNTWVGQYLPNYTGNVAAGNLDVTGKITTASGVFWANGTPAVYSNTAVAQYLPGYTGNLSAGNITTTSGLFWANGASAIGPIYGNTQVAQYLPVYTGNLAAGNIVTTSSVTVGSNLTVTQSGLFRGPYDENSALSGVFVGNTGTAPGITPRVGFFNGNTQQNWQIDNNGGEFRWFVPGATRLSLYPNGNLNVVGSLTVGGKTAINGPAFSAYAAAITQTITSGSQQKVLFQTEEFDTNNNYDNSRFTPTVEGYYQLNAEVRLDGATGTGEMMIVIWKNGSEYKRGWNQQGTQIAANFWAMTVNSLVYANGTTDFFEIYVQQGSGASVTITAVNSPNITWFNGAMVRGA